VLDWEKTTAMDTQKLFETEWVHVYTVKSGKITRWRGFFNTAARYSYAALNRRTSMQSVCGEADDFVVWDWAKEFLI
jgi:hypothetical protein